MSLSISRPGLIWLVVALFLAGLLMLAMPSTSSALPNYTAATGQACTVCHVNASGVGGLTSLGQAFAAVPNHASDPAAAFAQVRAGAPAAATATTAPAPTATPAPVVAGATPAVAVATPAVAAATPAVLPSAGEPSSSGELPMALALFGLVALGTGLTWSLVAARGR